MLVAWVWLEASTICVPSAGPVATRRAPIDPPPPATFSTTTGELRSLAISPATSRAAISAA